MNAIYLGVNGMVNYFVQLHEEVTLHLLICWCVYPHCIIQVQINPNLEDLHFWLNSIVQNNPQKHWTAAELSIVHHILPPGQQPLKPPDPW